MFSEGASHYLSQAGKETVSDDAPVAFWLACSRANLQTSSWAVHVLPLKLNFSFLSKGIWPGRGGCGQRHSGHHDDLCLWGAHLRGWTHRRWVSWKVFFCGREGWVFLFCGALSQHLMLGGWHRTSVSTVPLTPPELLCGLRLQGSPEASPPDTHPTRLCTDHEQIVRSWTLRDWGAWWLWWPQWTGWECLEPAWSAGQLRGLVWRDLGRCCRARSVAGKEAEPALLLTVEKGQRAVWMPFGL